MSNRRNLILCGLVAALILTVCVLDKPPERDERAITAATVAAAQEYDRALERYGDPAVAIEASDIEFERVMERWGRGETPQSPAATAPLSGEPRKERGRWEP